MGAAIRQDITKTLTGLMSQAEDGVRTCSASALGAFVSCLPPEERTDVVLTHILGNFCALSYVTMSVFVYVYGVLLNDILHVLLTTLSLLQIRMIRIGWCCMPGV